MNISQGGAGSVIINAVDSSLDVSGIRDYNLAHTGNGHYKILPVGGRAVSQSGYGIISGYSEGDCVVLNFDKNNGGLLVNQGALEKEQDEITVWMAGTGTASNDTVSGVSNEGFGVVFPNNPNRRACFIQNLGTENLWVRFSASLPTTGNLNFILRGGAEFYDGLGASWSDYGRYKGPLSITGINPLYTAWEL